MICWRLGSTASGLKVFNGLGILDVSRFLLLEHRHCGCKPKGSRDIMCVCVCVAFLLQSEVSRFKNPLFYDARVSNRFCKP